MDPINPQPNISQGPSKKELTRAILESIFYIILAAIGIWAIVDVRQNIYCKYYNYCKYASSEVSQFSYEQNETTNWKTYTNTKWGYEFKYPENVGIANDESGDYAGPPDDRDKGTDSLLIVDKEGTMHFQVNRGRLWVAKDSPLLEKMLLTFKPELIKIDSSHYCMNIVSKVKNLETGEIKEFPTTCEIPSYLWTRVD